MQTVGKPSFNSLNPSLMVDFQIPGIVSKYRFKNGKFVQRLDTC
jgi:hypothetical protein